MAALIRRSLEDAGLDRPGTAYCDPQLDRLAEYYAGLERPGAYWVAVERVGSRHGRGSGDDDDGGDDCDSVADNCGVSGHDTNVCGTHDLGADGVVVGGVGVAAWPGSEDTCELQKLYVSADRRGLGLGRRLLERALAFAGEHYRRCYLETHSSLEAACGLYRSAGFEFLDAPLPGGEHSARALAFAGEHYRRCYLETHSSLEAACGLYRSAGFEFLDAPLPGGEHSAMDMWAVKEVCTE